MGNIIPELIINPARCLAATAQLRAHAIVHKIARGWSIGSASLD